MNRQFLRTAAGLGSLSALALVMVGCGGSSSSAPATPANQAPTTPTIVGPTSAITLHPAFYNLSASDPEGDAITFVVNGTAISGNTYQLNPTTAGTTSLSVVARDSKGATSSAATLTVNVAANRAPQFISSPSGQFTGAGQTIAFPAFQVAAQDPDTDDVVYDIQGSPAFTNVTGGAVTINASTGVVSFTGAVTTGQTQGSVTFTVRAQDKLPGTSTILGASATQVVTLTYFTGNTAPVILTTSLPNLPANHFIPVSQGATGFPVQATDAQGDPITWTISSSLGANALVLNTTTGNNVEIRTGSGFPTTGGVPNLAAGSSISVTLTAADNKGLSTSKTFTISVVGDAKPTLNSSPYTETVSGVKFFDKSQVKDQVTSRARFYNGANFATPSSSSNFTYNGAINWISSYAGWPYVTGESNHATDALATDFNWSSPFLPVGADVAVAGWSARTIFRDSENDGINYTVDPRSVYVSSEAQPVGQPFTLVSTGGPSNVFPILAGKSPIGGTTQGVGEFPTIDAADGTMTWLPVLHENVGAFTGVDNLGIGVFANPGIWSYTVMGFEKIWNPTTSAFVVINDPTQAGRIDYSIKVQPNNRPYIGPALLIPGATTAVPGAAINQVVNPTTTVLIGGGPSAAPNYYGRPSIQEPESRRYDVSGATNLQYIGGGFDYTAPNTVKPAVWRWLFARAGGDNVAAGLVFGAPGLPGYQDAEIYDPDTTTVTGHQDAIVAAMGTPTTPAADTTGNVPTISASSVAFYNPWLTSGNAGNFEVTWGPNRIQYLIARVTASAAYSFPVETRDQYERLQSRSLGINPIFGTVRFTNLRTRNVWDNTLASTSVVKRAGTLTSGNYPGDPVVAAPVATPFTFAYLPFPTNGASSNETNFGSFLFAGTGPASGQQASSGLYTAASWISLYSTEAPQTGYHTGNPLNDESGTFNLPSYAAAYDGTSSSSSRMDVKQYNYTFTNGSNPTNPTAVDNYALGSFANHEVRAHVIPSNSPYLFSVSTNTVQGGYFRKWPTEVQGSTDQIVPSNFFNTIIPGNVGPTGYWYNQSPVAHGWVYNLYQGEIDMQNGVAGRGVTLPSGFGTTTLRWTYSWPTQVTQVNMNAGTGGVNNWQKGDVMQIAVPNQGANARYFFVGDGSINDPNAAQIYGWGYGGLSFATDTDNVFGTSTFGVNGITIADNTPFHVPSDSIWIYNNFAGGGTTGFLNTPNRTTFSPGASATQVPYGYGVKGYIDNNIVGAFNNVDPAFITTYPGSGAATPALINLGAGDNVYFLWMRHDAKESTAWGTWGASVMVPDGNGTYTATGGLTTVPSFAMVDNAVNSTLPASYASEAQISMAAGAIPGQNQAQNLIVNGDPSLYNGNILSAQGFARSQWGLAAPTVGYQPAGSNNVRLVNPAFDSANAARWNNRAAEFLTTNAGAVSYEGGYRDSAIIYAVRKRTDEKNNTRSELGVAGIEPGSPLLAQWYNITTKGDPALDSSTVAATLLGDVAAFPDAFSCYSPFAGNADWAHVMEFKMNYLVGVRYPDSAVAATNTLWKVPGQIRNVFPLGAPVTDPSCTNPGNTINPGNPIVRPIQFLRVSDYVSNTLPGTIKSTLDLVNSNPTNSATGAGSINLTPGGSSYLRSRSNLRVTWQASVNNQVIPSGYIVEIYQLTGTAATTNQPTLLATVRTGHIGGKDAIQKLYLPSMHSFSGIDGTAAPNAATYFFRVKTIWNQGINFEKQPTKQSIPQASADYVGAPFVTQLN